MNIAVEPAVGAVVIEQDAVRAVIAAPPGDATRYAEAAGHGLSALMSVLAAGGLEAMPDFAIVDSTGGQPRVLLRGRGRVAGAETIGSDGLVPWREVQAPEGDLLVSLSPVTGWPLPARLGDNPPPDDEPEPGIDANDEPPATADAPAEPEPEPEPVPDPTAASDVPPAPMPVGHHVIPTGPVPGGPVPGGPVPGLPAHIPAIPQPGSASTPKRSRVPWRRKSKDAAQPAVVGPVAPPSMPPGAPLFGASAPAIHPAHSAEVSEPGPEAASDAPYELPAVLAVQCAAGHPSPPGSTTCRECSEPIASPVPKEVPRPRLGQLRVSTGDIVPLDRGVLLGRAPQLGPDVHPRERPHIVRLASADHDISRQHALVTLSGWDVLVRDLGSTNGTTITTPGAEPLRLWPGQDYPIVPGTVITLADEVSLAFEPHE